MTTEKGVRILAGVLVLLGLGLGYWLHPYGYLVTVFVGVNLIQSAFTGFCPAEKIMIKMGLKPCNTNNHERKV